MERASISVLGTGGYKVADIIEMADKFRIGEPTKIDRKYDNIWRFVPFKTSFKDFSIE